MLCGDAEGTIPYSPFTRTLSGSLHPGAKIPAIPNYYALLLGSGTTAFAMEKACASYRCKGRNRYCDGSLPVSHIRSERRRQKRRRYVKGGPSASTLKMPPSQACCAIWQGIRSTVSACWCSPRPRCGSSAGRSARRCPRLLTSAVWSRRSLLFCLCSCLPRAAFPRPPTHPSPSSRA